MKDKKITLLEALMLLDLEELSKLSVKQVHALDEFFLGHKLRQLMRIFKRLRRDGDMESFKQVVNNWLDSEDAGYVMAARIMCVMMFHQLGRTEK